jgi:hypothetical protein
VLETLRDDAAGSKQQQYLVNGADTKLVNSLILEQERRQVRSDIINLRLSTATASVSPSIPPQHLSKDKHGHRPFHPCSQIAKGLFSKSLLSRLPMPPLRLQGRLCHGRDSRVAWNLLESGPVLTLPVLGYAWDDQSLQNHALLQSGEPHARQRRHDCSENACGLALNRSPRLGLLIHPRRTTPWPTGCSLDSRP